MNPTPISSPDAVTGVPTQASVAASPNWRCLLFGHKPFRYNGTFFIACKRCPKVMNFRLASGRVIK